MEQFGIDPSFWHEFTIYEKGGDLWITSKQQEFATDEDIMALGLRALRDTGIGLKPTTYLLQFLGDRITERVVDLDRENLDELVFEREKLASALPNGYVALRFRDKILGCGLVTSRGLETQVPKGRSKTLKTMLDG